MKTKEITSTIFTINRFLKDVKVSAVYFAVPSILALAAAFFDGISLWLLIPTAKGVIEMNFGFVRDIPVFETVITAFPSLFINTKNPNSSVFALLLATIFFATAAKDVLSYLSFITASYQARQLSKNMRNAIFSRYLSFGKLFFDRANIGHLNTVLINFTSEIGELFNYLRSLIANIFTLMVYLVIMCAISWKLAVFALFLFPALYYSMNWLIRKMRATSKAYAKSAIDQAWNAFDILSCIALVKSCSREKEEADRFSRLSESVAQLEFSTDKKRLLVSPIQEMVVVAMLLFIISIMAFLFAKGYTDMIPSFMVFFYILRKSAPLFNSLNSFKADVARIEGQIKEGQIILDDRDKFFVAEGDMDFKGVKENIEIRRLTFSYLKDNPVLKDISFLVEKNKVTALVGSTGSGKTTLANLIMRFYDAPPSSIMIDGTDIRKFTLKSLRKHIALVPQEMTLFNNTIKYNITYGLGDVSDEMLSEVIKKARLSDLIAKLPDGVNTLIGDRGVRLSGGEKQRLSIAHAMLKGSGTLILDEATSSLDSKTERLIQEAIDEAIKDKTVLVIAHRFSTIKNADKIVVMEHARLVEEGSLEELLSKKGKFYEYWQEQKFY